jgi:ECF-type transporter family protein
MRAIASAIGAHPLNYQNIKTLRWTAFLTGFIALSAALPFACHQFDMAGMVLLPIHFTVLTSAMIMGIRGGLITAMISPILSFAISGMPPMAALLPMTIELITYALVAGWLVQKRHSWIITGLIVAMIAGRFVSAAVFSLGLGAATSFSTHLRNITAVALPGIILQIALIPTIVSRIGGYLKNHE